MQDFRRIKKIFNPLTVPEGKGATVKRIIGTKELPKLNPFLMLDHFSSKLPAGFPDHPHRGFETVTYMLEGKFYHEDFLGNKGTLSAGDIQWMTAGRGILHAEMPASDTENSIGLQLWLNLEAKHKMCPPQYQEWSSDKLPIIRQQAGVTIKLIAGEALGNQGPIYTRTPAFYIDIQMEKNITYQQRIPKGWNGLCYIYEGEAQFSNTIAKSNQVILLDIEDQNEILQIQTTGNNAKFILIAGQPINEPIVAHGPFVMNTQEEIRQTFEDFQQSKNGFEGAQAWRSEIRKLALK